MKVLKHLRESEKIVSAQENIIKIQSAHRAHPPLKLSVDLRGYRRRIGLSSLSHHSGIYSLIFSTRDHPYYLLSGDFFFIYFLIREDRLDEAELVILIEDYKIFVVSESIDEHPQKIYSHRVKCPHHRGSTLTIWIDLCHLESELATDSLAHFLGGFIRKSHTEDRVRRYAHLEYHVCHSLRESVSLARSGSSEDEHRSIEMVDGFLLF